MSSQGNTTNEGNPAAAPGALQGRFVVLRHVCGPANGGAEASHWDLMVALPESEKLATWQVRVEPAAWSGRVEGRRLEDHRQAYMTYEGEVSGGRGWVERVDEGEAEVLERGGSWRVRLHGQTVRGEFVVG